MFFFFSFRYLLYFIKIGLLFIRDLYVYKNL